MKAVEEGKPIREKQGPKFKISLEEEKEMVEYLGDCWKKDDARTQMQFGSEIVHFLQVYNLKNNFRNGIPGKHNCSAHKINLLQCLPANF